MSELRSQLSDRGDRSTPSGPRERFRAQAGRRASGCVLDIGARQIDDVPDYRHLCYLAVVGAAEVRDSDLPLKSQKIEAEPHDLPFPDRTFNVVVCRFALSRARNPALVAREMARVLHRTGQLVFLDVADRTGHVDPLTHLRLGGLVTHHVDWTGSRSGSRLVQGVATHPCPQYENETAWLLGRTRGGNHDDEESRGLPRNP